MYDDADFIAQEITKLADQGKDVVLIGHSYGGVPVSQCGEGLSAEARAKQGKKGGLVRLAYMTCLVPALGQNARDILAGAPDEDKVDMKVDVRC
jgi:surfactin synthase thioesterase subunit